MRTGKILYATAVIILMIIISGCSSENKLLREKFISGGYKMIVCPVHLLDRESSSFDRTLAEMIADYFNEKKISEAEVIDLYPPPNGNWMPDQSEMADESLGLLIEFVRYHKFPNGTYIFYCEILRGGKNSKIVGIHYYLVDNVGRIAIKGILNSHNEEFIKEEPVTNEDCVDALINGFENKVLQ
ncbi:MAG TPA: hypothetical protein PLK90_08565 [Clostridiales bacterium]|nr:hypothetical protein [Clostridiales bacterium]HQP70435.1 hypothetical protein [Clostridiales bacterium]